MPELRTPLRSEPGWSAIRYIEEVELERERNWWEGYACKLTPQEKRRIRGGNYNSFRRPICPGFQANDWLTIGPNLDVQVADVMLHKGKYRIRLSRVRDFRSAGTPIRTYGEDPRSMANTLSGAENSNPPEQAGVSEEWLKRFAEEAEMKRAGELSEAIRG